MSVRSGSYRILRFEKPCQYSFKTEVISKLFIFARPPGLIDCNGVACKSKCLKHCSEFR